MRRGGTLSIKGSQRAKNEGKLVLALQHGRRHAVTRRLPHTCPPATAVCGERFQRVVQGPLFPFKERAFPPACVARGRILSFTFIIPASPYLLRRGAKARGDLHCHPSYYTRLLRNLVFTDSGAQEDIDDAFIPPPYL